MKHPALAIFGLAVAAVAAATCSGCLSPVDSSGRLKHKDYVYEPSGLDYVEFIYVPVKNDARFPAPVRIYMSAGGTVTVKHGKSPLVLDEMSTAYDDADWNDIREERISVSRDEFAEIVQSFINEGLVPNDWRGRAREAQLPPVVRYAGKLNFEKFSEITSNKYMVETVEDFLFSYFGNTFRRQF